ncbi:hypothetical protein NDU88_007620 [Pleurodeles waltl]|uniref:Uncharacterized protein n=1 Tax=Pleurodeles waltl TaxID=8319 RepID=A0AAV7PPW7_PLEWA|nr:hypothetical protein NDU88_007620 [Pleurodeles waltl]
MAAREAGELVCVQLSQVRHQRRAGLQEAESCRLSTERAGSSVAGDPPEAGGSRVERPLRACRSAEARVRCTESRAPVTAIQQQGVRSPGINGAWAGMNSAPCERSDRAFVAPLTWGVRESSGRRQKGFVTQLLPCSSEKA